MPISTPLNRTPYFNDFDTAKEYYETLFKPSVAVQVRELNSLQSYLQAQIERFGDNIFKSGTIVSGCNFAFYPNYNFIKLTDSNIAGTTIDPSLYVNLFVTNEDNLKAYVTNFREGFESTDPNLKTIFVTYINSGTSGNTAFAPADVLTVYNGKDSIFSVIVDNGGQNFSNTDTLVFSPIIEVNTTSGTFALNDYISDSVYSSNAQITLITTISGSNNILLTVTPRTDDLTNVSSNSTLWTFGEQDTIQNDGATAVGSVVKVYGTGAAGRIITDGVGIIVSAFMTDRGEGYTQLPYVTVKSPDNATGLATVNLEALNYFDKIRVASVANPVGNGYAFGVGQGTIYQVGHFLKVDDQIVIVNAYSSTPNNVTVGFFTEESIVDYHIDSSLTDNALGTENENAPGADRLKLQPVLVVANTADVHSNTQFLSLVEWNDGNPFKQTQVSVYSKIGDEMATRTEDASGNFVLDPFLVTTASIADQTLEGADYTAVIDPGTAYISGYKTSTIRNFKIDVPKGTATIISNNVNVSLNYDAYVRVKEVGGLFQFSTADTVDLYDTAKTYLTLGTLGTPAAAGVKIGTARMRSMVLENGVAGDAGAVYRIFLFNIAMNAGKNFRGVKSLFYNGTNKGIADVVLELDPSTATNVAVLKNPQADTLVFPTGVESIRNSNNTTYTYRTIDQTTATANTGLLVKSVAANPNEFYPYSSTLSSSDLRDLYIVPLGANLVAYTALTGTVTVATNSPNVVGSSTTFINNLQAGDYLRFNGTGDGTSMKKVKTVVNNTVLVLDSNNAFSNTTCIYSRAFPKFVPIPVGTRSGITANLDVNRNVLTINFGMTMEGSVTVNTALGCSIKRTGATSTAKTPQRSQYVKLQLSNNAANTQGPWCLGTADAFRLRHVYIGDSTVNLNSIDIGSEFYIDPKHNPNYLDLSYLYLNPKTSISLTSSNFLLVGFDYFTRADDGYFDTVSYLNTSNAQQIAALDSLPLSSLSTHAASFEVPEFFDTKGNYYDLLNCLDFRPAVVNTVTITACSATAPLNPPYTQSFGTTSDPANDKKFPLPDSSCVTNIEQYMGRTDVAVVGQDGNIVVQQGNPNVDPTKRFPPTVSPDSLTLNRILVPAYPNISLNLSNNVVDVIDTSAHTQGQVGKRLASHTILPLVSNTQTSVPSQPKGFSMASIGNLERRIRNLEYVVSLSILETSITSKIIPSSIDATLNRFKFGFSADDFSTRLYSDITNPQYAAEIEVVDNSVDTTNTVPQLASNLCVPPKFRWTLRHETDLSVPYIDFQIVSQDSATVSPDIVQPGCVPSSITVSSVTQVNTLAFETAGSNTVGMYVKFSSLSGHGTLFFDVANDPAFRIYQSTHSDWTSAVLLADSSTAVSLSNADVQFLRYTDPQVAAFWLPAARSGSNFEGRLTGRVTTNNLQFLPKWGPDFVLGSGKVDFTHDPSKGLYYFLIVTGLTGHQDSKYHGGHGAWKYWAMMRYPIDSGNANTIIDPCGKVGAPIAYSGCATARYGYHGSIVPDGVRQFDSVIIKATGMLPETRHYLYVNGIQDTTHVKPWGGQFSEALLSDATGCITCLYNLATTNWVNREAELGLIATPDTAPLILNEGQTFASNFVGNAYNLFELIAPNSRAGARLDFVPWSSF